MATSNAVYERLLDGGHDSMYAEESVQPVAALHAGMTTGTSKDMGAAPSTAPHSRRRVAAAWLLAGGCVLVVLVVSP